MVNSIARKNIFIGVAEQSGPKQKGRPHGTARTRNRVWPYAALLLCPPVQGAHPQGEGSRHACALT